jgi:AcrR family transcriptional regulator
MAKMRTKIKNKELVEKRRRQVIDAAVRLFLQKGFHATTIREICRESGVNRGSLYDYFTTKNDILVLMYEEMMKRRFWRPLPRRRPRLSVKKSLEEFLRPIIHESWTRNRDGILILYRETDALDRKTRKYIMAMEAEYIQFITKTLKTRYRWKGEPARLEILANLLVFVNAFFALRGWNLKKYGFETVLDVIVDSFVKVLVSPSRK